MQKPGEIQRSYISPVIVGKTKDEEQTKDQTGEKREIRPGRFMRTVREMLRTIRSSQIEMNEKFSR